MRPSARRGVEASFFGRQAQWRFTVVVNAPCDRCKKLGAAQHQRFLSRGDSNTGASVVRVNKVELAADYLTASCGARRGVFLQRGDRRYHVEDRGFRRVRRGSSTGGPPPATRRVSRFDHLFRATTSTGLPITNGEHTQRLRSTSRMAGPPGYEPHPQMKGRRPVGVGGFQVRQGHGGYVWFSPGRSFRTTSLKSGTIRRGVEVQGSEHLAGDGYPPDLEVVDESLPPGAMSQTEWPRSRWNTASVVVNYADALQ